MTTQEIIADWCADWHASLDALAEQNRQRAVAANELRLWAELISKLVAKALAEIFPAQETPRHNKRGGGPAIPRKPITPHADFYDEVASEKAIRFAQTIRARPMANLPQAMASATLSARRDLVRARARDSAATVTHGERLANWPEYPSDDVVSFAESLCALLLLSDQDERAKLLLNA